MSRLLTETDIDEIIDKMHGFGEFDVYEAINAAQDRKTAKYIIEAMEGK